MSNKIVISGYYGFGNLGDEAILETLVHELKDTFAEEPPEIVVLSNSPASTKSRYEVQAVGRWKLLRIIDEIRSATLLVSGGGGLLQDKTSTISLWYYLGILNIAYLTGTPAYIIGQGIGPIRRRINRALLRFSLKRVKGSLVRDQASMDLLKEMDIQDGTISGPDLAFLYPRREETTIPPVFREDNLVIGAAVKDLQTGREEFIHTLSRALDELAAAHGATIVLFSTHSSADERMCQSLQENTRGHCKIIHTGHITPEELITMIGDIEVLVGGRLHALEFALLAGTPAIGISYDPKMDHFIEGLHTYTSSVPIKLWHPEDMVQEDEFKEELFQLFADRESLRTEMLSLLRQLQNEADQRLNTAMDWFREDMESADER